MRFLSEDAQSVAVRGFYSAQAVDPDDPTGTVEALIPKDLLQELYKTHPVDWHNVTVALEVLRSPARIYHDVREYQEGGWCYSGRPVEFYMKPGIIVPLPDHLVFAVYVNPSLQVYLWRLEKGDPADPFAPDKWRNRYGGVSWKRDS